MSRPARRTAALLAAASSCIALAADAQAASKTWAAAVPGNWTDAAAWSLAGTPANGDNALIIAAGASSYLVNYDNPSTTQLFPFLTLNNTGGGTAQLRTGISGAVYNVTNATVGGNGLGFWQIGSATANIGSFNIATAAGGAGTVTLSSGDLNVSAAMRVGTGGTGAFTQTGGTSSAEVLSVGSSGGTGLFQFNGGTHTSTSVVLVGNVGSGTVNHAGGALTAGNLQLGANGSSSGTYNMTAGTLSVSSALQVGAAATSTGTFLLATGTVNAGTMHVGAHGNGIATHASGRVNVANQLILARDPGSTGLYQLQGGTLTAGSIHINANATFARTGGTLFADAAFLNAGGTFDSPSTGAISIGAFTQNGGTVSGGYFVDTLDSFIFNGGTFSGRMDSLGTVTFNSDMTMADGWQNRAAANQSVPAGRTVTLEGFGLHHRLSSLFLLGNVNSTISRVGGLNGTSTPSIAHQSGVHSIADELCLGDGASAGTYNLNGGTLNATGPSPTGASIGTDFPGQLNLGNGRANISFLRVGQGAAGTVNHTGSGDLVATNVFVGNATVGRYTQNNAGAQVTVSGQLVIGNQAGAAGSRYDLLNGTLTVNGSTTNNGSFTQSGGRATLQAVGGTGRMDVINTASLTVDRIRQDFLFVADSARIFTVANGGASGVSRLNNLFFEDFENLNFFGKWDLNNNDLLVDHDAAAAADNYDRVKRYIQSGFAGGSWNGNGLNSSAAIAAAATSARTGLGYAKSTDVFSIFPATFVGQNVDSTAVLVRYTLLGDGNLDGTVNIGDFAVLASNFNLPGDWVDGDFNYNGQVTIADFAQLAAHFNLSLPGGLPDSARPASAVPEAALSSVAGAAALLMRRRSRRSGRPLS